MTYRNLRLPGEDPNIKQGTDEYCIYLRKSRADIEAEARGEGETLKRHKKALLALAKKMNIRIPESAIYQEIVSGERISERPEMIRMLEDIEEGKWAGVLVMEIERLARGDTMDQGLVAQAFKYAGTKIITPMKIYDPNNEFDEEYFEFGLFMSRREYKTINRRQQAGRLDSVDEGDYIGSVAPYGYNRIQLPDKSWSLEPHPEQAPIVVLIYDLYVNQGIGCSSIAIKLAELAVPTIKGGVWSEVTVRGIIRNPVYKGLIIWGRFPVKKTRKAGKVVKTRKEAPESSWKQVQGKHVGLVSIETWNKAREILAGRYRVPAPSGVIQNPLAGLIRCADCGRAMQRRPYDRPGKPPTLMCATKLCKNVGCELSLVEDRILDGLKLWIINYKSEWQGNMLIEDGDEDLVSAKAAIMADIDKQSDKLELQKSKLHDLLESGVYTPEVFLERAQNISLRIEELNEARKLAQAEYELEQRRNKTKSEIIPALEHVLEVYHKTSDAGERNALLKTVLEVTVYKKEKRGHWRRPETLNAFDLKLFPKLPE